MVRKTLRESLTKADVVLVIIVFLLALFSGFAFLRNKEPNPSYAICEIDGEIVKRIPLDTPQMIDLGNGMELEVQNGKICVAKSDCSEQICVKHGWLKDSSDIIVCVPSRCIIYIEKQKELDYITR